jgi:hypothetical protein
MSTNKYYYNADKCCIVNKQPPISKNLLNVNNDNIIINRKKNDINIHIIHKTDTYYDNLYNEGDMCDYKYTTDKTLINLSYSEKIKKWKEIISK